MGRVYNQKKVAKLAHMAMFLLQVKFQEEFYGI